ncbi:MAG: hypothetical protein COU90_04185 [Candidatus Ryanbacteria bacterium CG10_big_fil_rev_8_21_14_0_10_43_42]|uniref:SGNH hydrolase-type esterase domain-containing protein n=1 Tax=Candidatus Ryanbacteria bacterium CG10_big_fil_rev_8_21_14_0_10_43_42 TaxID=1974864 RepID=A0A2M8KVZ3_9BACT|nr:MAG: hypothetical protein COU90_04185 [Candidatus Ryanbacteria bacterium CG10_big_fil_rev_8_21_14_0_10_43_42]
MVLELLSQRILALMQGFFHIGLRVRRNEVPFNKYLFLAYYSMQKKYYFIITGIIIIGTTAYYGFLRDPVVIKNYPLGGETIVVFGDSLVEGIGSSKKGGFVALLEHRLQKPVSNLGRSGDTTETALGRVQDVIAEDPDLVIVLLGGNDAIRRVPLEMTVENLRTIIRTIQAEGAAVVLLGVQGALIRDRFDNDFRVLAKEEGAVYIPNILEDIYRNPSRMFDGIHPNDEGYGIITNRVYPIISELLTGTYYE